MDRNDFGPEVEGNSGKGNPQAQIKKAHQYPPMGLENLPGRIPNNN